MSVGRRWDSGFFYGHGKINGFTWRHDINQWCKRDTVQANSNDSTPINSGLRLYFAQTARYCHLGAFARVTQRENMIDAFSSYCHDDTAATDPRSAPFDITAPLPPCTSTGCASTTMGIPMSPKPQTTDAAALCPVPAQLRCRFRSLLNLQY